MIDRRDEQSCPAADRVLAVIAIRMAAGDLLARTGRPVPLVLETEGELFDGVWTDHSPHRSSAYHDIGDLARSNHPIASALRDYSRAGRQIVLLTTSQSLATELSRVGARSYQLHASPVVHAHRPLWKPHYQAEHYVGPHPHTDGHRSADEVLVDDQRTDWSRDGYGLRDGYYAASSFTTNRPTEPTRCDNDVQWADAGGQHTCCNQRQVKTVAAPVSPFFLTVDSPVDQAPSIDAVAAARLRGLKVTHINHLMQQDSNRLSDALGLVRVDSATIRRWKAESRLVCQVPQLRGFDARVLVGCGVTTPAGLAAIHPDDLLQQVEAFLATDHGQQILLSGSSHELSRITSWIATANSIDHSRRARVFGNRDRATSGQTHRHQGRRNGLSVDREDSHYAFDSARNEYETGDGSSQRSGRRRRYDSGTNERKSSRRSSSSRSTDSRRSNRRGERSSDRSRDDSTRRSRDRDETESRDLVQYERESSHGESQQRELRFFLQRESQIVDAPSIGARMAERLNGVGFYTVDDLLNADPETLARELDHRGVDSDRVLQWQQQAMLVCRVPMLRGHDAQLLVAAKVTTPEELAQWDASELLEVVDPIARSRQGKRIIRGGKLPDLEEVANWISFGSRHRELLAA